MEFCLLGPLEVRRNGEPVQLGGAKQRALLARLLVDAPRVVSTDALVDGLWGERPPEKALHTVQVFVSRLRKAIGPKVLVTRAPGYLVDVADEGIDVSRFRTLVAEAERDLAGGRPQQASQCFERALALWRGPALADFAYEGWAGEHAERLEEERLSAVERLIDARLLLGHHSSVAGELEQLVSQHPLRERLRAQLMLTLYRSGRQADALRCMRRRGWRSRTTRNRPQSGTPNDLSADLQSGRIARRIRPRAERHRPQSPRPPNPLVGRDRELEELAALLQDTDVRLVTLTGPGGTGKTRLAMQVAAELVGAFADGVFWVPLAGLRDPHLVLPAMAQAIGANDELAAHLRERELLLLVDNFEQVLAACRDLGHLLAVSPGTRLLVTSRAPLRLAGEHEYPLEPLAPSDAGTLFIERARAAGRELEPDETIAAICRRLDYLPLAIELAAARAKLLDPQTLLTRLDCSLALLTRGAADAPERHRTLRTTIQWSHDLLNEEARVLFRRLSVFAGSCSIVAAERVCDAHLDTVEALVDLGLLKPIGEAV